MTIYFKPGKSQDAQNVFAVIKGGIVLKKLRTLLGVDLVTIISKSSSYLYIIQISVTQRTSSGMKFYKSSQSDRTGQKVDHSVSSPHTKILT